MLDVFITSRVRRKIIVVYAKYPDFKTHVRGLAKLIKEDAGNIQREIKRLRIALLGICFSDVAYNFFISC